MPRTVQSIECKICNKTFSSVGIATHLRTKHHMTVDTYVTTHGEFRKNVMNKVLEDTEPCLVCNDGSVFNTKGLTVHLRRHHGLSKLEYVKQHILNNQIPTCKCGCGHMLPIKHFKTIYCNRLYKRTQQSRYK
jgi:predicted transcriptional regulator